MTNRSTGRRYIYALVIIIISLSSGRLTSAVSSPLKANFIQTLEKGKNVTIVTFGTSLTAGTWQWSKGMRQWLDLEFPGLVKFVNYGVGASSSAKGPGNVFDKSGLDVVPRALRETIPDVAFIEFGINDAYTPYGISTEDSRRNLNILIDLILACNPQSEIIIQTMNTIWQSPGQIELDRPKLPDYYQVCRDVALKRGLILIDHYRNWSLLLEADPELFRKLIPDGVHPQQEGYDQVVLPELKKVLAGIQPSVLGDADYPAPSPCERHTKKVEAVRAGNYDLFLIGNSITQTIGDSGGEWEPLKSVWNRHFTPRNAINLGYSGYRTENILWNLLNGELDQARSPKVAMLLIGTNNLDDQHYPKVHTAEEVFRGTKAIVDLIRQRHPATKILILRIFECGGPGDETSYHRKYNRSAKCLEEVYRAGEMTSRLADGKQVFWIDVNHVFLRSDGTINTDLMPDMIHPNEAGTEAWVSAVEPLLSELMGVEPIPGHTLRLSDAIGDHMVLQQNSEISIWGWNEPGIQVKAESSWGTNAATISDHNGAWRIRLRTPEARSLDRGLHPEQIIISDKSGKKELSDILIGEVWLCSGQSNMEMYAGWDLNVQKIISTISGDDSWKNGESQKADRPGLRLLDIANTQSLKPLENCNGGPDTPEWTICTPTTAGHFSAAGYFFASILQDSLRVPVGIISADWSGTPAETWMDLETLRSVPGFEKAESEIDKGIYARTPSVLFNGMIAPLTPMAIKGVIWYQGEDNMKKPNLYVKLFPSLINSWRKAFTNPEMPFYFVQIAPYTLHRKLGTLPAELRDAQLSALTLQNTGMAVVTDVSNINEGHPRNKRAVGHRLALQALKKTYGRTDIVADGPFMKEMKVKGRAVRITFEQTGSALTTRNGLAPDCFEIAGADSIFVPAVARIAGNRVIVSNSSVSAPLGVRLSWDAAGVTNLMNREGLPACQFREWIK